MHIELTCPPSLNKLFAGYPKRHKSNEYEKWLRLASIELSKQTRYKIKWDEWLEINLTYFMPIYNKDWTKKTKDLDNYFKALMDFLWDNIEWFKDKNIKVIKAEKKDSDLWIVKIFIKEIK